MAVKCPEVSDARSARGKYPPRLDLGARQIDLWLAACDEIHDERLLTEYRLIMEEEEREQERRFKFAVDSRRYVITRVLARTVLSRYESVDPHEWTFTPSFYGRPEIATPAGARGWPAFSISHTRRLIVIAVTRGRSIGVDVEDVTTRTAPIELAERFFAPAEAAELRCLPPERCARRFWDYWTLKESYIKARGIGMSIPIDQVVCRFPSDQSIDLELHPDLKDDAARWKLLQMTYGPEYVIALCADRLVEKHLTIRVRKTIPLREEGVIVPTLRRSSMFLETLLR